MFTAIAKDLLKKYASPYIDVEELDLEIEKVRVRECFVVMEPVIAGT